MFLFIMATCARTRIELTMLTNRVDALELIIPIVMLSNFEISESEIYNEHQMFCASFFVIISQFICLCLCLSSFLFQLFCFDLMLAAHYDNLNQSRNVVIPSVRHAVCLLILTIAWTATLRVSQIIRLIRLSW